ncbi:hypothetical protein D3C72_1703090 [compost metagenome]
MSHRAVLLEGPQRRDLLKTRPVFMLQHHARRQVLHDATDHRRCHLHGERERIVLQHEWDVRADRLDCLPVIADDLVISAQRVWRSDHDPCGALRHYVLGERAHGGKPGR